MYVSIALMSNFNATKQFPTAGCAAISYSGFEDITGGSRSLIARGVDILRTHGLIETGISSRTTVYQLRVYENPGYAQLPKKYLLHGERLSLIAPMSLRNKTTLNGLKLYLLLAAFRDHRVNRTRIAYDKIAKYAGINRGDIRPAISILVEHRLIHCNGPDMADSSIDNHAASSNEYLILGLKD